MADGPLLSCVPVEELAELREKAGRFDANKAAIECAESQRAALRDLNAAHATIKLEFERMRLDRADAWAKTARLAKSLVFYAEPGTYFAVAFTFDPPTGGFDDDFEETELGWKPGKRAREALGK